MNDTESTPAVPATNPPTGAAQCHTCGERVINHCNAADRPSRLCDLVYCPACRSYGTPDGSRWVNPAIDRPNITPPRRTMPPATPEPNALTDLLKALGLPPADKPATPAVDGFLDALVPLLNEAYAVAFRVGKATADGRVSTEHVAEEVTLTTYDALANAIVNMASTGHGDARMLEYYDRARDNIERNVTHGVAAFVERAT